MESVDKGVGEVEKWPISIGVNDHVMRLGTGSLGRY
jgi:hypothetical protein